jgi:hypothetical protein
MRFAAFLAVSAVLLPAGALASSTRKAHIAVRSTSPVSIQGTGFKARERVVVTVMAKSTRTKAVRATTGGAFAVTFPSVSIGYCQEYAIRAKGNRGSTAIIRVIPECPSQGPAALVPKDPPKKP